MRWVPDRYLPSGLPGFAVRVTHAAHGASAVARALRTGSPPVFGTVHDEALHLHVRTLRPDDDDELIAALRHVRRWLATSES